MRSEEWDVYCIRVVRGIFLKVPGDLGIPWPLWCWIPGKVDQDSGSDLILSAVAAALRRGMQPCNHVTSSQIAFPWERVGSQVCVKFWQDSERKTYLPISAVYDIYTPLGPAGLRRPQSSCFAKFFSLSPFWRVIGWRYYITWVLILVRHLTSRKTRVIICLLVLKLAYYRSSIFMIL